MPIPAMLRSRVGAIVGTFPGNLNKVAIWVCNLDRRVARLFRPFVFDEPDRSEPFSCSAHSIGVWQRNAEVELADVVRGLATEQGEGDSIGGADNEAELLGPDVTVYADDVPVEAERTSRVGDGQGHV